MILIFQNVFCFSFLFVSFFFYTPLKKENFLLSDHLLKIMVFFVWKIGENSLKLWETYHHSFTSTQSIDYCFEIFCFAKFYRIQCLWKIQLLDLWWYLNEKNFSLFSSNLSTTSFIWKILFKNSLKKCYQRDDITR